MGHGGLSALIIYPAGEDAQWALVEVSTALGKELVSAVGRVQKTVGLITAQALSRFCCPTPSRKELEINSCW